MYVSIFYLILFLLSLAAAYFLLRQISNKKASYYVVLFTLIPVVCLAYFAYSIANNADMALVANQFSYLDGTFVMVFFLFCVLDICGIKVRRAFGIPIVICCLIILALAFTTGKVPYFYAGYEYAQDWGASHLIMEFGPLHKYFLAFVILNTLAPMGVIIYSVFNKKKISYKYTIALGALEIAIVVLYFIQSYFGLGFDLLPTGYVLMEYVILAIIQRIALYDMSQIVLDGSEERKELGYIIFDRNKAFVGANSVAKFYFPEVEELDIDRQVDQEFIKSEFVEVLDTEGDEETVKTYERQERIVSCSIKPYVHGSKNKVYGYVVEIKDDTKQQRMIQRLNKMNEQLEEAVMEAKSASQAKSDFLASMSHEIRTPINAILGMNEIALRECKDETLVSYLKDIQNAGSNLLFIINDILDFSKIEAGRIEIIDTEYNLAGLIRDVRDLVGNRALEKNLEFILRVDEKLPSKLLGDENRIRQIMINILNNAVKYTPSGSVEFTLTSRRSSQDGFALLFIVRDTGIGIKQENIPVLFESFSRVDQQKNRSIEGTGLGLAITKQLVDMMGGTILVDSIYGEGTTFTVTLPQQIVDETGLGDFEARYKTEVMEGQAAEHIDASDIEILVVDDNKVNLKVAKGLLKATNAKVTVCKSGAECLGMIAKKHFHIILLDHMMPEMDGIETLKRAKAMEDNLCSDSVYIALTANAISGVREMYIQEGFDDYISKPIDPAKLERTLAEYIK